MLVKRDAILAALRENEAQRHRVAKARIAAFVHIDVATEAIETAMVADAAAVAEGRPGGAVKAARTALKDAPGILTRQQKLPKRCWPISIRI